MNERHSRQSFLGSDSERIINAAKMGVVGLGGGGSHIVQQLAHIGFPNFVFYDHDEVEETNLNRLVGAVRQDAEKGRKKMQVASKMVRGLIKRPKIVPMTTRWQGSPEQLSQCDIVFGCVDGLQERNELEAFCRRHLIPYIDIGMDVFESPNEPPRMAGQVILSIPGGPCMWCLRFLNEANIAKEASLYGAAGHRPQVIWPNGILASSAVGIAVDLLTGWTRRQPEVLYRIYDGNTGEIRDHPIVTMASNLACAHYPFSQIGQPVFKQL